MFYNIKKSLIQAGLNHRKKSAPFDERACELFEIKPDDPHEINNSFFLGAHTEAGDDLTLRLGMRNGDEHEIFVIYRTAEGQVLYMEHDHYPAAEMPVQVTCEEVGQRWRYIMDGYLRDDAGKRYKVEFDVLFFASLPIYDFVQAPERHEGMTTAIARAHWNRAFFRAMSSTSQKHYEQTGRIEGSITIDGKTRHLRWAAVRDRAIGKRVWDFMDCHLWLNATTDKGEAITVSLVSYPVIKSLFSGYTNIGRTDANGNSYNATLTDCRLMRYDHADGKGSDLVKVYTRWSDGRAMVIEARRDANVLCTFDHGDYIFQEGLGQFMVNAQPARGNIEFGFNKDANRWGEYV